MSARSGVDVCGPGSGEDRSVLFGDSTELSEPGDVTVLVSVDVSFSPIALVADPDRATFRLLVKQTIHVN